MSTSPVLVLDDSLEKTSDSSPRHEQRIELLIAGHQSRIAAHVIFPRQLRMLERIHSLDGELRKLRLQFFQRQTCRSAPASLR